MAVAFFLMEGVAWFLHKYVMHGFLWSWHESHHRHQKGIWEKNDRFAICFSILAATSIYTGFEVKSLHVLIWIGLGVSMYGVFYGVFHDVLVHRRVKIRFVGKSKYLKRIIRAHYSHHAIHTKEGAHAFGFLYAPKKYEVD
ncbi:MAG: beta-carotene hydroxylase [Bacteroidota bacterium]